jgi:type I restriction enzyme S subunit
MNQQTEWKYQPLESILSYVIGGDWGKDPEHQEDGYELAYCIRASEMKNWKEQKGKTAALRKIKSQNIKKRKLEEGDIILEISGGGPDQPVGRTVLIDKSVLSWKDEIPKICTNFFRLIRPKDTVDSAFLNYYLGHFHSSGKVAAYQAGSNNLRNLKFNDYIQIEVPLPPLPIQRAIVAKLEALFSELDKGIEQLKTAQQQLRTYRQAVLKAAFEGRLTGELGKDGDLPEGWKWVTIGDISENVEYGSAAKSKETGKVPVLRMGNIQNGIFEWDDLVFTDDDIEINKYKLNKDDVLFNRTNSPELVGKTAIYKGERPAIFAGYLIRINYKKNLILGPYLTYYLNTKAAKEYGNSVRSFGVNQSNINGTKLKTYPIPLAPIEEQTKIISEIESRLSVADKMEESIAQGLQQAEALRQSILKKAFEGKFYNYA